jgi:predicted nucleotidyltransferase
MPTKRTIDEIVRAYLVELKKYGLKVERAYLFGSQARGDNDPDSDIDLLLVSSAFAEMPVTEQWKILGKAVLALMEPIEPLTYTPEEVQDCLEREGNFIRHILRQPETIEYRQ